MHDDSKIDLKPEDADPSKDRSLDEVASETLVAGSTVYYAYCSTENKMLGNYTFDKKVAENTVNNHKANNNGHAAGVYIK